MNQFVKAFAGLLVLVDYRNIGGVGVNGNSSAQSAGDQVIAVRQILELNLVGGGFYRGFGCGIGAALNHIGQVFDKLGIVSIFLFGDRTGVCIVYKEGIFNFAVSAKQYSEELVVGCNAVGNCIGSTVDAFFDTCIKNLIDTIGFVDGCVGDGNGAVSLSRKSGNAQGKKHCQHHKNG